MVIISTNNDDTLRNKKSTKMSRPFFFSYLPSPRRCSAPSVCECVRAAVLRGGSVWLAHRLAQMLAN